MIANLTGTLLHKNLTDIVIDVNGVGYKVQISLQAFSEIGLVGEKISLMIVTIVREDAIDLYGFKDEQERFVFRELIKVNKVGPKLALTILSGLNFRRLAAAVINEDLAMIETIPGIGTKTAKRLIAELADKLRQVAITDLDSPTMASATQLPIEIESDLIDALLSLGYKKSKITKAIKDIIAKKSPEDELTLEALLRESINLLSRH
ncbi:MAG: Holliday junction branch migration protein RuvA [Nitrospinota bacterium]